jgi:chromosome partitioning protein
MEERLILTLGNTKGGVGKSTLATNLAILRVRQGRDVLLVDADEQGTSLAFTEARTAALGSPGYTAVALRGDAILSQVPRMAEKYDDIVIDAGGRDTKALRAALIVADAVLVPLKPRSFDVWSFDEHMKVLIGEAQAMNKRLDAMVMLNMADPSGQDNRDAAEMLSGTPIRYLDAPVGNRKAFSNAGSAGKSVLEMQPRDPKACRELEALGGLIYTDIAAAAE